MKKLLSLFLAFVIALGLLPTGAFAADSVEAALPRLEAVSEIRRHYDRRHSECGGVPAL